MYNFLKPCILRHDLGSEWVAIIYSNFYEGKPFLTFTDSTGFPPAGPNRHIHRQVPKVK